MSGLPSTMKAVFYESKGKPLVIKDVPTPQPERGSVIIELLYASVTPLLAGLNVGAAPFPVPENFIPGTRAVGRVAAVGSDAALLKVGQLVVTDCFLRARDDPDVQALWGMFEGPTPIAKEYYGNNWKDGNLAQYIRAPLENTWSLNEEVLCGKLGYSIAELAEISVIFVPYGGFRRINLTAGETVVIAPATGIFSGAAVGLAVAMGAKVIAMGRNEEILSRLKSIYPEVRTVKNTGTEEEIKKAVTAEGPIDVYLDISPAGIPTTHVSACLRSLKPYGRAVLMGLLPVDVPITVSEIMMNNTTIQGQYMFERQDAKLLIKMIESGVLKYGKAGGYNLRGEFKFAELDKALEAATKYTQAGDMVVISP